MKATNALLLKVKPENPVTSGEDVESLFERRLCPDGGYVTRFYCHQCPKRTTCRVWGKRPSEHLENHESNTMQSNEIF
jgi:hypothetical protein